MERADYLVCLREQGAQSYANTNIDRQVGQLIVALEPRDMIMQEFYGPTPSTDLIKTNKYI